MPGVTLGRHCSAEAPALREPDDLSARHAREAVSSWSCETTRVTVFTLLQGAENADRIFKSLLRCLRVARRIDSKEVLTKVLNTMWALQVVAIVREVQQGLVVDCDMAIFEGLGARFEQLDMS